MATRLLIDISVKLDANGAGFVTATNDDPTQWREVSIALQLAQSAFADLVVGYFTGSNLTHRVGFGVGATVVSGPFALAPNESIGISITGGVANDTGIGTVWGVQNIDPTQLDAKTAAAATLTTEVTGAISGTVNIGGGQGGTGTFVRTSNPRQSIGQITLAAVAGGSTVVTPNSDALQLILLFRPSTALPGNPCTISCVGSVTGIDYATVLNEQISGEPSLSISSSPYRLTIPIDPEIDPQYTVTVQFLTFVTTTVNISESLVTDTVEVLDSIPLQVQWAASNIVSTSDRRVAFVMANRGIGTYVYSVIASVPFGKGIMAITGTQAATGGTVTTHVAWSDGNTGATIDELVSIALAANVFKRFVVYPGVAAIANEVVNNAIDTATAEVYWVVAGGNINFAGTVGVLS